MKTVHLHLVSDSTADTAVTVARASLVRFADVTGVEHIWNLVRQPHHVAEALAGIEANPGFVLYTLVERDLRNQLEDGCRRLGVPVMSILAPVVSSLRAFLNVPDQALPGRQHALTEEYFKRIDAIHYALDHDDGQVTRSLDDADVILVGVSRTSKTPTCMYLANRGVRAANVPLVPGTPLPDNLLAVGPGPMVVGLTQAAERLVSIRRNRLLTLKQEDPSDYIDMERVREEIQAATRLCNKNGWPVIDVSRRSIEETAATIIRLLRQRQEREQKA